MPTIYDTELFVQFCWKPLRIQRAQLEFPMGGEERCLQVARLVEAQGRFFGCLETIQGIEILEETTPEGCWSDCHWLESGGGQAQPEFSMSRGERCLHILLRH